MKRLYLKSMLIWGLAVLTFCTCLFIPYKIIDKQGILRNASTNSGYQALAHANISTADDDDDGLTIAEESELGTDPGNPDTDGDGIIDGGDPSVLAGVLPPDSAFKDSGGGLRKAMLSRLDDIEDQMLAFNIEEALRALENLKRRVDGCLPTADKDDWIVNCDEQLRVRNLIATLIANHFSYTINSNIIPPESLPGIKGGPPRPVGVAVGPSGKAEEFIINEVILKPDNTNELYDFLAKYNGSVLQDGKLRLIDVVTSPPKPPPPGLPDSTGYYLIQIDPAFSQIDDIAPNMEAAGLRGNWSFSSDEAAKLMALVARETGSGITPNFLTKSDQSCTVCEHPLSNGDYADAATWWWMNEDDNPATSAVEGLSIGVIHAWEYLKYKGYPPMNVSYYPVRVAIIDRGFDLDETTGVPLNGNLDYFFLGSKPMQLDEVDVDWTAGGPNPAGGVKTWHGQLTFGVCCAYPRNLYGTAGTGGSEVRPILIRASVDWYTSATAVYDAIYNNADVINMSSSGDCCSLCRTFGVANAFEAAIKSARNFDTVVVASAGNDETDTNDVNLYPGEIDGAICVGAIDENGKARDYSNFGWGIDIWAPDGIRSTVTRTSAGNDANDLDIDELHEYYGTSCSSPFVAGIVALMKMLENTISYNKVLNILSTTANNSSDPKVPQGYVDAFRAVTSVKPNKTPTIDLVEPEDGTSASYILITLKGNVIDPELSGPYSSQFPCKVVFNSEVDGELCTLTGVGPDFSCTVDQMSTGTHHITATATDAFGAAATSDPITINVINQPPIAQIMYPSDGSTFYTSQKINLQGFGFDPEDDNLLLKWVSDIDGFLGYGGNVWFPSVWDTPLTAGTHKITLTVEDVLGETSTDTITIYVNAGAGYPTAKILKPAPNSVFGIGEEIAFEGSGTDPDDGILPYWALNWKSDKDGPLGTGTVIATTLSGIPGNQKQHTITLEVTDSDGNLATHSITVLVVDIE